MTSESPMLARRATTNRPVKVALLWNAPHTMNSFTVRLELYVQGLRACGAEVITLCAKGTGEGYAETFIEYGSEAELMAPGYWQTLGVQVVVVMAWHRMTNLMAAAKAAGVFVIAIGESTGEVVFAHYPLKRLVFSVYQHADLHPQLLALRQWARRLLLQRRQDQQHYLSNIEASHVFTLAGEGAMAQFRRSLMRWKAPEQAAKLACVPYPVRPMFVGTKLHPAKQNQVIAVGRWNAEQKNPELLAKTILLARKAGNRSRFVIVGRNARAVFAASLGQDAEVELIDEASPETICMKMQSCRALLLSSRWESGPVVVNEILALGGTVVGTPLPNVLSTIDGTRFGQAARRHSAHHLAQALLAEMALWDTGQRDAAGIAEHWRARVSSRAVALALLDLYRP